MSTRIYKYELVANTETIIDNMPAETDVLCAQAQGEDVCIWARVNPEIEESEERTFLVAPTGEDLPNQPLSYIDSCQQLDGVLVWHIFEVLPECD
jgi:hypothetical protein